MKTLNLNQMEVIEGGAMTQRNCLLTGAAITVSFAIGFAVLAAWAATAGFIGVGLSGDCF